MARPKDITAIPVNANIPEAVLIEFEVAMARRRMKKQDALAEAMTRWAESCNPGISLVPELPLSGGLYKASSCQWESAHIQLDSILNSGDTEAQTAILSNLAVFSRVAGKSNEREPAEISAAAGTDIFEKTQAALDRTYQPEEEENVATAKPGRNRRNPSGSHPRDRGKPEQVG